MRKRWLIEIVFTFISLTKCVYVCFTRISEEHYAVQILKYSYLKDTEMGGGGTLKSPPFSSSRFRKKFSCNNFVITHSIICNFVCSIKVNNISVLFIFCLLVVCEYPVYFTGPMSKILSTDLLF